VHKNYWGGAWHAGGGGVIDVENPATGEVYAQQALASTEDVDAAVAAARAAVDARVWSGMRPGDRGRMVRKLGEYFSINRMEIASELALESGKPLFEALIEVDGTARYFEYYGCQSDNFQGESIPLGDAYVDFTELEPLGISAQIIPWNYPLEMVGRSVGAALAVGCVTVIKTPELDPISSRHFALAAEYAGLPVGVMNLLCGEGVVAGAALAGHPDIDQVVFTGSVETGRSVAKAAAQNLVPCVLELGGKSAAIVRSDADLDLVMDSVRWGIFFGAGQVCSALSRVIIHQDLLAQFTERVAQLVDSIDVLDASSVEQEGLVMGAMVNTVQRDRAAGLVQQAIDEGARVLAQGGAPASGAFYPPTVLQVVADSHIAQTEVFGPVLCVIPYETDAEALAIANGTEYGLVSGVFSEDINTCLGLARRLRAGQVFINEWFAGGVETPFGGVKKSGYGREKGREAMLNYVATKNIAVRLHQRS
jgi:aldehyde dehydrogenase (NAD+)